MTEALGCQLIWTVDSAAELRRQLAYWRDWASRCWHMDDIPDSKASTKAIRAWSRLVRER